MFPPTKIEFEKCFRPTYFQCQNPGLFTEEGLAKGFNLDDESYPWL